MNITEDYVSFEVAKLLKEKGFDVPCLAHWFIGTNRNFSISNTPQNWNEIKTDLDWLSCPTHQMAMKWLREKYDLPIIVFPYKANNEKKWCCKVYKTFNLLGYEEYINETLSSYEEAVEAALKYSLENLI